MLRRFTFSLCVMVLAWFALACGGGGERRPESAPQDGSAGQTQAAEADAAQEANPKAEKGREHSQYASWVAVIEAKAQDDVDEKIRAYEKRVKQCRESFEAAKQAFDTSMIEGVKFSKKKAARAKLIESIANFNAAIAARPGAAPSPTIPAMEINRLSEGDFGRLDIGMKAFQIIDDNNALMKLGGKIIWVVESTSGMVNGENYRMAGLYECIGTRQYKTPIGTSNTVHAIRARSEIYIRSPKFAIPIFDGPKLADADIPEPTRPAVMPPAGAWASDWKSVGDVRVRVAGVAFVKATLVDKLGDREPSPKRQFVAWIEVQNLSKENRVYRRWQPTSDGECTAYESQSVGLDGPKWPNGLKLDYVSEFEQTMTPGGNSVIELIAFDEPVSDAKVITLKLSAARVGEKGFYTFPIPVSEWRK